MRLRSTFKLQCTFHSFKAIQSLIIADFENPTVQIKKNFNSDPDMLFFTVSNYSPTIYGNFVAAAVQ